MGRPRVVQLDGERSEPPHASARRSHRRPPFPAPLPWFNVAPLRMDQQLGRPVLIEFWDFCRPNSIRTLPYMKAWHERYSDAGLRVIGVHAAGFEPSADPAQVEAAVARLEIPYPVVVDVELEIWSLYGNLGWPARYLFNQRGTLFEYHYGEGAYDETERAIQELLGVELPLVEPIRPEDAPGAAARAPERRRRRALQRALPGRRGVGGPRRPRHRYRQRPLARRRAPGLLRAGLAPAQHPRRARARRRRRASAAIAVCFTPGLAP